MTPHHKILISWLISIWLRKNTVKNRAFWPQDIEISQKVLKKRATWNKTSVLRLMTCILTGIWPTENTIRLCRVLREVCRWDLLALFRLKKTIIRAKRPQNYKKDARLCIWSCCSRINWWIRLEKGQLSRLLKVKVRPNWAYIRWERPMKIHTWAKTYFQNGPQTPIFQQTVSSKSKWARKRTT